jgi:hypothetical protein
MNLRFSALLIAAVVAGGCATNKEPAPKFSTVPSASNAVAGDGAKLIVTPLKGITGKVATYNATGRFVVLDFPVGHLPTLEQTLFVYRQGLKVGEVKVTGPERDTNTVADLVSGEAQRGDEVRDR